MSPFYREASGGSERCWTKAPALGPGGSQSSSSSGAACECWPEREAPAPPWPLGCHPLPAERGCWALGGQVCSLAVGDDALRAWQPLLPLDPDSLSPGKERGLGHSLYSHHDGCMDGPTVTLSALRTSPPPTPSPAWLGQAGLPSPARLPPSHPVEQEAAEPLKPTGCGQVARGLRGTAPW